MESCRYTEPFYLTSSQLMIIGKCIGCVRADMYGDMPGLQSHMKFLTAAEKDGELVDVLQCLREQMVENMKVM